MNEILLKQGAFSYLDIISWLESKINNVNVQDVIREKYKQSVAAKTTRTP
jgi:hypothetical protein